MKAWIKGLGVGALIFIILCGLFVLSIISHYHISKFLMELLGLEL